MSFFRGGNGQVEGCQIWGNKFANVYVHDSGSQAVVKGCECANAQAFPVTLFLFRLGGRLHQAGPQRLATAPSLLPLPIIAWQDSRWKQLWSGFSPRRQGAGGGLPDMGQLSFRRSRSW